MFALFCLFEFEFGLFWCFEHGIYCGEFCFYLLFYCGEFAIVGFGVGDLIGLALLV